jgi:hypothetical protein
MFGSFRPSGVGSIHVPTPLLGPGKSQFRQISSPSFTEGSGVVRVGVKVPSTSLGDLADSSLSAPKDDDRCDLDSDMEEGGYVIEGGSAMESVYVETGRLKTIDSAREASGPSFDNRAAGSGRRGLRNGILKCISGPCRHREKNGVK